MITATSAKPKKEGLYIHLSWKRAERKRSVDEKKRVKRRGPTAPAGSDSRTEARF
jgi:hypothetical protein